MVDGHVPPQTTISIASRPQIPFRGWKLMVHRPIASNFLIHDIRAGNKVTTVTSCPIPADAFITNMDKLAEVQSIFEENKVFHMQVEKTGAELLGTEWCLPLVSPGTEITMVVENIAKDHHCRFIAGMLGFGDNYHY